MNGAVRRGVKWKEVKDHCGTTCFTERFLVLCRPFLSPAKTLACWTIESRWINDMCRWKKKMDYKLSRSVLNQKKRPKAYKMLAAARFRIQNYKTTTKWKSTSKNSHMNQTYVLKMRWADVLSDVGLLRNIHRVNFVFPLLLGVMKQSQPVVWLKNAKLWC